MMKYAVEIENLTVTYNNVVALEDVNLRLYDGEFLAVMGPNGAGKTTLLRAILGMVKPIKGKIKVYDHDVFVKEEKIKHLIGYVPQKVTLSKAVRLTVGEVVLMGVLARKIPPRIPSDKDVNAAMEALKIVGLEGLWDRDFLELSGGQQRRVLIARALVSKPKLLLLDEPLTGIDVRSQAEIAAFLHELNRKHGVSILMVTHDINPVAEYVDRVALLFKKIHAIGKPEEVLREDILSKVYGGRIRVFSYGRVCFAIIGDVHR